MKKSKNEISDMLNNSYEDLKMKLMATTSFVGTIKRGVGSRLVHKHMGDEEEQRLISIVKRKLKLYEYRYYRTYNALMNVYQSLFKGDEISLYYTLDNVVYRITPSYIEKIEREDKCKFSVSIADINENNRLVSDYTFIGHLVASITLNNDIINDAVISLSFEPKVIINENKKAMYYFKKMRETYVIPFHRRNLLSSTNNTLGKITLGLQEELLEEESVINYHHLESLIIDGIKESINKLHQTLAKIENLYEPSCMDKDELENHLRQLMRNKGFETSMNDLEKASNINAIIRLEEE